MRLLVGIARLTFDLVLSGEIGGFAIKVEASGVAHEWDPWFRLIEMEGGLGLYNALICLVGDSNGYYSCGMHHFGLPDVEVPGSLGLQEAANLINEFNNYQIFEKPKLANGHTFSLAEDAPKFQLLFEDDKKHSEDALFNNANGIWKLELI